MTKQLNESDLSQFSGSGEFYRTNAIMPMITHSEGCQYVAENGGAYWLLEAIGSHIATNQKLRQQSGGMIFWELKVHEVGGATLIGRRDSDEPALVTQEIPYTDFPLDSINIWSADNGKGWTLYLPSEH